MKEKANIVKVHNRTQKSIMPTLLKFQNGKLAAINNETTQFCQLRDSTTKTRSGMVVANGQIYHGELEADELTDTYICVRNKTTNQVRIIPIDQMRLKNSIYNTIGTKRITMSKMNSQATLLKQFGGRVASRFVANQENSKVNIDMLKDELDNTVKDVSFTDDAADTSATSDDRLELIRPKFNKDAMQLHEVYDIDDVIPAALIERLNEEAMVVSSTAVNKLPIKSEFLIKCISDIQKATSSSENMLHLKLIIYMDCLMNLIKLRVRNIKSVELSGITEKVENDVRARFSDPKGKPCTRTVFSTEKALCHYIVLAMLISKNYQVNLSDLAQDLCTPRQKILKFAQLVCARPKGRSDCLVLNLPSKVPALPVKNFKKSKK